ncbi:MAG: HAD hydrolase-like protein [Actinomycetota bacterium]|nr:HAD hydrolase-like protein [Actinomycetota bacterium]
MTLNALIFDVDGTLAESEVAHREAFNRAFGEFGLSTKWDEEIYIEKHLKVAGGFERLVVASESDSELQKIDLLALHRRKNEIYVEIVRGGSLHLKRGVARLIREAKRKSVKIGVATTTSYDNVAALIEANFGQDIADIVDFVGAGDVVELKKPSPLVYEYVLDGLGVDASSVVAIEDSDNGIIAATSAALTTLVVHSRFSPIVKEHKVAAYIRDLGEDGDRDLLIKGPPLNSIVDLAYITEVHRSGNYFQI